MKNVKTYIAAVVIGFASTGVNAGALTVSDILAVSSQAKTMCTGINDINLREEGYKVDATVKTNINLLIAKVSAEAKGKYVNYEDRSVLIDKISEMVKEGVIGGDRCVFDTNKLFVDSLKASGFNNQAKQSYKG